MLTWNMKQAFLAKHKKIAAAYIAGFILLIGAWFWPYLDFVVTNQVKWPYLAPSIFSFCFDMYLLYKAFDETDLIDKVERCAETKNDIEWQYGGYKGEEKFE